MVARVEHALPHAFGIDLLLRCSLQSTTGVKLLFVQYMKVSTAVVSILVEERWHDWHRQQDEDDAA